MIIQNAVFLPGQNAYVVSFRRHDFCRFTVNNIDYHIDGGSSLADGGYYFKSNFSTQTPPDGIVPFFLYGSSSLDEICDKLLWGSRNKDGSGLVVHRPIKDLDIDHLKSLVEYVENNNVSDLHKFVIKYWANKKNE